MRTMKGNSGLAAVVAAAMIASPAIAQNRQTELELDGQNQRLELEVESQDRSVGGFWIGVRLEPVNPLVKSQLNIDHGLAVAQVIDDGPAKEAGMKENDILLSVDGKPAVDPGTVVDLVNKFQGQKIKVDVLRRGKRQMIDLTPMPRPEKLDLRPHIELDELMLDLPRMKDGEKNDYWFIRPGVLLPEEAAEIEIPSFMVKGSGFPADTKIEITKEGDAPARIAVQQGEKFWTVDENGLEQLPDDVRAVVERAMGKMTLSSFQLDVQPLRLWAEKKRQAAAETAEDAAGAARVRLRERREQLMKKRDEVQRKAIEAIGESEIPDHVSEALQRMEETVQSLKQNDVLGRIESELKELRHEVEQLKKAAEDESESFEERN